VFFESKANVYPADFTSSREYWLISSGLTCHNSLKVLHAHYKNRIKRTVHFSSRQRVSLLVYITATTAVRVHARWSRCAFLTRTSSERKAPAKCILLSPIAVAPTYLHMAFAWDINVMQVVKVTRHEIHASPWLSRKSATCDSESPEERLKRPDLNVMKEHIGRNDYIRMMHKIFHRCNRCNLGVIQHYLKK